MDVSAFVSDLAQRTAVTKPFETFPGDNLTERAQSYGNAVSLGPGLKQDDDAVNVRMAGLLRVRQTTSDSKMVSLSVEPFSQRRAKYSPRQGDQVVGIIEDRGGEFYKVNIFAPASALLPRLAFENATKRNKPELQRGDVVYARIAVANKDVDVELTCVSASGIKKDWSSGETIYGPLSEGLVLSHLSLPLVRSMLRPECVLLNSLGKALPFEITVGMNGAAWIKAGNVVDTIIIRNAVINADLLADDLHTAAMVEALLKRRPPN